MRKDLSLAWHLATGMHENGKGGKQFWKKSENSSHNSSVILFTVDRKENSIRLGSGK